MRNLVAVSILLVLVPAGIPDAAEPGRYDTPLVDDRLTDHGLVSVWNSDTNIYIQFDWEDGWALSRILVDIGEGDPPMSLAGNPLLGSFNYTERFSEPNPPVSLYTMIIDLADLGRPQKVNVAIYCTLVPSQGNGKRQLSLWAFGPFQFPGPSGGYWFPYLVQQP